MTLPPGSGQEPLDLLLADVAIRLQLSATDYKKAVDRYEAVSTWIERDESPLSDCVGRVLPPRFDGDRCDGGGQGHR